jgi:hypothetical protein
MATRPKSQYQYGTIGSYTTSTGETTTKGKTVVLDGADDEVKDPGAASDLVIGVALDTTTAGQRVSVLHFGPIVPMVVGTGDATRGKKLVVVADGVTDASTHDSDGTGNESIVGVAMQSGVATDQIGVMLILESRGA